MHTLTCTHALTNNLHALGLRVKENVCGLSELCIYIFFFSDLVLGQMSSFALTQPCALSAELS